MTDREAYIILNLLSGIGPIRVQALCSYFGSSSGVLKASVKELNSVPGIGPSLAEGIASWDNIDYESEMAIAERAGVKIITRNDPEYPSQLAELNDAPLCLYVRGTLPQEDELVLAIVGSRRITNYGRRMAEHLAASAVYAGWTISSGLAYGIDAVAHKAAIDAGGKTIAVLGGGLARIFPQDHIPLAKEIIKNGAVISEFPMEFSPNRRSFPMRNRIISGLSRGTLVVEAGQRSGALITANFALEQGKLVFAVPGCADNPQARGCNSLIKQGAKLTESFDDILDEFEFLPGFERKELHRGVEADKTFEENNRKSLSLSEEENKIMDILSQGEQSADSLAIETGLNAGKLLVLLMKMEMKKLIVQLPGKRFSIKK